MDDPVGPDGRRVWNDKPLEAPASYNFAQAAIYRLKLSDIPDYPGVDLYPTLEVVPAKERAMTFLAHSSVPVSFTRGRFPHGGAGNYVVKVIYLPDPQYQDIAVGGGLGELISTQLEPGLDPIAEASKRGSILVIARLGNIDLELRHSPAMDAPPARRPPGPAAGTPPGMGMMPPGMMPPGMMTPAPGHGPDAGSPWCGPRSSGAGDPARRWPWRGRTAAAAAADQPADAGPDGRPAGAVGPLSLAAALRAALGSAARRARLWHGLPTVPRTGPKVSSGFHRRPSVEQRGTVRRPCHNRCCSPPTGPRHEAHTSWRPSLLLSLRAATPAQVPRRGPSPLLYVRFTGRTDGRVTLYRGDQGGPREFDFPVTIGFRPGYIYRVKIEGLPGQKQPIYPTLEVRGSLYLLPQLNPADTRPPSC